MMEIIFNAMNPLSESPSPTWACFFWPDLGTSRCDEDIFLDFTMYEIEVGLPKEGHNVIIKSHSGDA